MKQVDILDCLKKKIEDLAFVSYKGPSTPWGPHGIPYVLFGAKYSNPGDLEVASELLYEAVLEHIAVLEDEDLQVIWRKYPKVVDDPVGYKLTFRLSIQPFPTRNKNVSLWEPTYLTKTVEIPK